MNEGKKCGCVLCTLLMMVKKFQLLDLDMKLNQSARSVEREEVCRISTDRKLLHAPSDLG